MTHLSPSEIQFVMLLTILLPKTFSVSVFLSLPLSFCLPLCLSLPLSPSPHLLPYYHMPIGIESSLKFFRHVYQTQAQRDPLNVGDKYHSFWVVSLLLFSGLRRGPHTPLSPSCECWNSKRSSNSSLKYIFRSFSPTKSLFNALYMLKFSERDFKRHLKSSNLFPL